MEVPSIRYKDLSKESGGETSEAIKTRVDRARDIQLGRFKSGILCNARMSSKQIKEYCVLDEDSKKLIEMAVDRLGLSARAYTKILKVARTIADLENEKNLRQSHISEAIQYRTLDRDAI